MKKQGQWHEILQKNMLPTHCTVHICNGPLSQEAVYLVAFERTCQVKLYYENVDNKCSKIIIIWQKNATLNHILKPSLAGVHTVHDYFLFSG